LVLIDTILCGSLFELTISQKELLIHKAGTTEHKVPTHLQRLFQEFFDIL